MKAEGIGFIKQVCWVLAGALAVGAYPLYAYGNAQVARGVLVGCGICTANVLAGCFSVLWAFDKPQKAFLKAVFGGMVVRMALIGLTFFLLIRFTEIHIAGLTLSLFLFYVIFQVLEIRFLTSRLPARQVPNEGV